MLETLSCALLDSTCGSGWSLSETNPVLKAGQMPRNTRALLLFSASQSYGRMDVKVLLGMWHFLSSPETRQPPGDHNVSHSEAFLHRLSVLIGSLLDILRESFEVRLMHKTLQPYLRRSTWICDHLPPEVREKHVNEFRLRIYVDITGAASYDTIVGVDDVLSWSVSDMLETGDLWYSSTSLNRIFRRHFRDDSTWCIRIECLIYSVKHYVDQARLLEIRGVSFKIGRWAMSSCLLMITIPPLRKAFSSWHWAHRSAFKDLIIAIEHGLSGYIEDRLRGNLLLEARDSSELLIKALSNREIFKLLRTRCWMIQSDFLFACWTERYSLFNDKTSVLGHNITISSVDQKLMLQDMTLLPPVRRNPDICENDSCGRGDDLVHWWARNCTDDGLSFAILELIIESGESINTQCKQGGTALHILINERATGTSERVHGYVAKMFMRLIAAGADHTIKHEGQTPLQLARTLVGAKPRIFFGSSTPSHSRQNQSLAKIMDRLTEYENEEK